MNDIIETALEAARTKKDASMEINAALTTFQDSADGVRLGAFLDDLVVALREREAGE